MVLSLVLSYIDWWC